MSFQELLELASIITELDTFPQAEIAEIELEETYVSTFEDDESNLVHIKRRKKIYESYVPIPKKRKIKPIPHKRNPKACLEHRKKHQRCELNCKGRADEKLEDEMNYNSSKSGIRPHLIRF